MMLVKACLIIENNYPLKKMVTSNMVRSILHPISAVVSFAFKGCFVGEFSNLLANKKGFNQLFDVFIYLC